MTPTLIPGVRRGEAARLVIGGEITHYPTIDLALAALRAAEAASVRVDEIARKPRARPMIRGAPTSVGDRMPRQVLRWLTSATKRALVAINGVDLSS